MNDLKKKKLIKRNNLNALKVRLYVQFTWIKTIRLSILANAMDHLLRVIITYYILKQ